LSTQIRLSVRPIWSKILIFLLIRSPCKVSYVTCKKRKKRKIIPIIVDTSFRCNAHQVPQIISCFSELKFL
jgi:hypothetical protein